MSKLNADRSSTLASYKMDVIRTGIVTIEGTIGAGKSTLKSRIEEMVATGEIDSALAASIVFVDEPVAVWDTFVDGDGISILKRFYESPSRWAFSFQMMAYISRLAALKQARKNHPHALIVAERSLDADRHVFAKMLHDSGDISTIEFSIYTHWFDHFAAEFKPDLLLYLRTPIGEAKKRIQERARDGEAPIDVGYLQRLETYTDAWTADNVASDSCVVLHAFDVAGQAKDVNTLARDALVHIAAAAHEYNAPLLAQTTRRAELQAEMDVTTRELRLLQSQLNVIDAELDANAKRSLANPSWDVDAASGSMN